MSQVLCAKDRSILSSLCMKCRRVEYGQLPKDRTRGKLCKSFFFLEHGTPSIRLGGCPFMWKVCADGALPLSSVFLKLLRALCWPGLLDPPCILFGCLSQRARARIEPQLTGDGLQGLSAPIIKPADCLCNSSFNPQQRGKLTLGLDGPDDIVQDVDGILSFVLLGPFKELPCQEVLVDQQKCCLNLRWELVLVWRDSRSLGGCTVERAPRVCPDGKELVM